MAFSSRGVRCVDVLLRYLTIRQYNALLARLAAKKGMPYNLPLPGKLASSWRVKIYDSERLEPPHVTIVKGRTSWRINLRSAEFMDDEPPPRAIHKKVMQAINDNWGRLQREWNRIHPDNPVELEPGANDGDDH
jgi:hypothetical protein